MTRAMIQTSASVIDLPTMMGWHYGLMSLISSNCKYAQGVENRILLDAQIITIYCVSPYKYLIMALFFRRLATSHFEPTYARRAFPCFDEPQLKARFLMTITHDKETVAFFNTPKREVSEVRGRPNLVRDEFEESVVMSTYLVAFVVCDFASMSKSTKKKVNVSVIATPDKIDQVKVISSLLSLQLMFLMGKHHFAYCRFDY